MSFSGGSQVCDASVTPNDLSNFIHLLGSKEKKQSPFAFGLYILNSTQDFLIWYTCS